MVHITAYRLLFWLVGRPSLNGPNVTSFVAVTEDACCQVRGDRDSIPGLESRPDVGFCPGVGTEGLGFKGLGVWALGFRGLGFRGLRFRGLGIRRFRFRVEGRVLLLVAIEDLEQLPSNLQASDAP